MKYIRFENNCGFPYIINGRGDSCHSILSICFKTHILWAIHEKLFWFYKKFSYLLITITEFQNVIHDRYISWPIYAILFLKMEKLLYRCCHQN